MSESDFLHVARVRSWMEDLARLHPEERAFLDDVAAQVGRRSTMTLHYGALGLRGRVQGARDAGECSAAFQARADAVLWGLEVLAEESARLPVDVVAAVVETSLACGDAELSTIGRAVVAAERVRWRELAQARVALDAWAAEPRWEPVIASLRAFAETLATAEAIERFERRAGVVLPAELRAFLLLDEAVRAEPRTFTIRGASCRTSMIQRFLSIEALEQKCATFKDGEHPRMPPEHIPIATCEGGDYLTYVVDGPNRGQIFLWDHEEEGDEAFTSDNLSFVAGSLADLVASSPRTATRDP